MKSVLILYATREGQTKKIAARIAAVLTERGARVELADAADSEALSAIDPGAFDLVVIGASMHAGGLEGELVAYVNEHKEEIEQKPRSLFLVLLSAATRDPELRARWLADARERMRRQLQVTFEQPEMIAGALAYSKYGFLLKGVMKRIAAKAGEATDTSRDYEYTDWKQVEEYAARLAEA